MRVGLKRKPSRIGHTARIFDEEDILRLLRATVALEGSQNAFARRYGIQRSSINLALAGKRPVSEAIKKVLGLRRTYTMPNERATASDRAQRPLYPENRH
jgi:hypothetical protein